MKIIIIVAILNLMTCLVFAQNTKPSEYKIIDRSASSKNDVILTLKVQLSDEKSDSNNLAFYTIFDHDNKPFLRSISNDNGLIPIVLHQPKKIKEIFVSQLGYESVRIPIIKFIGFIIKMDVYLQKSEKPLH